MSPYRPALICALAGLLGAPAFGQGFTKRASVNSLGELANYGSRETEISADGRFVAFRSGASNLDGQASGQQDVYVHDLLLHRTERVSLTETGDFADGWSDLPKISGDGRFVAFVSYASNLVPGDLNGARDVYLRDRLLETTLHVSLSSTGEQSNNDSWPASISGDGRYVLFSTRSAKMHPDGNTRSHFYLRDTVNEITTRTTETTLGVAANQDCKHGFLSAGTDWVVFSTISTNLGGGGGNARDDIYLRDLSSGVTEWISQTPSGGEPDGHCRRPSISADGRWIAFMSNATNLVAGDTNGAMDIFLHDRSTGTTQRINRRYDGSESLGPCDFPRISADGNTIVFQSSDSMLVPGDTNGTNDVFFYDRLTDTISNANVGSQGVDGDRAANEPVVSGDGNRVAFQSGSTNLIGGSREFSGQLYVHTRAPLTPDPMQLHGPTEAAVGDEVTFYWANGAPLASEWFTYSLSNAGRNQYGHVFDLGLPVQTLFQDSLDANGGDLTAQIIPPMAAGLTVYLEVVSYDGSTILDSNARALTVLP